MSIIITVSESTSQIISGIPEYIEVETNIPAIVFYTFDGADPDIDSEFIEDSRLYLPTTYMTLNLKLIAISGAESSDIFDHDWATSMPFITKRFENTDGISVLPPGVDVVDSLSVNADGDAARETTIEFVDLEIQASSRDKYKKYDGGKTSIDFINFKLEMLLSEIEPPYQSKSSTVNNNLDFDPKAGLLIIDGSTPEKMAAQSIKIINRPHDSMSIRSNFYNEHLQSEPISTANLVRYFINPRTGKMVFYYFDSRECRWINSIQQIDPPRKLDIGQLVGNPRVFAWIQDPVMSRIF